MSTWILLCRLDLLVFAAAVFGSTAFILRLESVRKLLGARTRRQWYWVIALVVFGGFGAELQSVWTQHGRRGPVRTAATTYAYEIARAGHADLPTGMMSSDPRRRAIELRIQDWMQLNPDLIAVDTLRPVQGGVWRRVLHSDKAYVETVEIDDVAEDDVLRRQAWAGETVFDAGPWFLAGTSRVRTLHPLRDERGRVEAVLEIEFSRLRQAGAVLGGRVFTFAQLYLLISLVGAWIIISQQRRRFREHMAELELRREGENRFRSLCENIPNIAVQGYDRHRRVTFWNRASEELYGYSQKEVLGRPLEELIIPEAMRAGVVGAIAQWHEQGIPIPAGELVLRHKNGAPVSVYSSHVMQRDSRGEPEMYCVDVSLNERDRALAALSASETNYRSLFETIQQPLYVFDLETLALLAANHATSACYGYSHEELLRMHVLDLPLPEHTEAVWKIIRGNAGGASYGPGEWQHRRKDGSMILVEIFSYAVVWGGRRARLILAQDITARRVAERRLAEQAALLDKTAEAIVVVDQTQRITFWNASATRLFGAAAGAMVGRSLTEPVAGAGAAYLAFARVLADTGHDWRGEISAPDAGGRPLHLDASVVVIRDEAGRPISRLSMCTDITLRKALEAQTVQTQKMEVLGHLAGGVAHDFNSILMAMSLQMDMLGMDRHSPPATRTMLADLKSMAQRAAKLVEQLLLFARKRTMELRPLELNAELGEVLKMVQPLMGPDIVLELVSAEPALWVEADNCMLDQVVLNLCVNARDAMPRGGRLRIALSRLELDEQAVLAEPPACAGVFACLEVRDTGCGLSAEAQKHLFEPFFTTKEPGKGTGLGLSTVHGIVHQHRGWITVESTPGEGAAFRVFLPLAGAAGAEPIEGETGSIPVGQETILLVEDDPVVRRLCSLILVRLGYRVMACADAREALERWAENSGAIDVLLSDLILPGTMNGRSLAARLSEQQPALGVVLMSGNNEEIIKADSLAAAGFLFVQKPVDSEKLSRAIRRSLE